MANVGVHCTVYSITQDCAMPLVKAVVATDDPILGTNHYTNLPSKSSYGEFLFGSGGKDKPQLQV